MTNRTPLIKLEIKRHLTFLATSIPPRSSRGSGKNKDISKCTFQAGK